MLVVFSGRDPMWRPCPLRQGCAELGRDDVYDPPLPDPRVSRKHVQVSLDDARWTVRDLTSRNGTWVDGAPVHGVHESETSRVVRAGDTLALLVADLAPYAAHPAPGATGPIVGAPLRAALDAIANAARAGDSVLVHGESGSGKELAARHYHASGPNASGPLVTVNCATIPAGLAERLLFGTVRGAYSGATDTDGTVQAADGGVLFLDEIAELEPGVQAKLLRVLDSREVMRLGSTTPHRVDLRVCAATHCDLRASAAAGHFRRDLYYRLSAPTITLPPLRVRLDEIPWHVARAVATVDAALRPHASLVERCLLSPWPGNVRELHRAVGAAAACALGERSQIVRLDHLALEAGHDLSPETASRADRGPDRTASAPTRERIEAAIARSGGRIAEAARALGLHRNQLYRELAKHGIKRVKPS